MALQSGQSHGGLPPSQAQLIQQQTSTAQIQQQNIQLQVATNQQLGPTLVTNIVEGGQIQVPIVCMSSANIVSSSSSPCQVRSIQPRNKIKQLPNAQAMQVTAQGGKVYTVNQQQQQQPFVQQFKPTEVQQRVVTPELQQVIPTQAQQGTTPLVVGAKNMKKPGMMSPVRLQPLPSNSHMTAVSQQQSGTHQQTISGDNLSGQTITVEAVECTPLPGQSRRLIKIVVSGAKGQAHSLLSQNTQLQSQILNMMQKAHTSAAEVSFPSDPEQPIRVTCKPKPDVTLTGSQDSSKKQGIFPSSSSPLTSAGGVNNAMAMSKNSANTTNACAVAVQRPVLGRGQAIGAKMANVGVVARALAPAAGQQVTQPSAAVQARFSKVAKTMPASETYVRSVLRGDELNATKSKDKPVGVATQYINQTPQTVSILQQQQQLTQSPRPQSAVTVQQFVPHVQVAAQQVQAQASIAASNDSTPQIATIIQATKESGSIQVISPGKSGVDASQKYIPGNNYIIKCPNGKQIVGQWDGKYFKLKSPMTNSPVSQTKVQKFVKSTSTATQQANTDSSKISVTTTVQASREEIHKNAARSESQSSPTTTETTTTTTLTSTPTGGKPVRKRPLIPKQEGKYAVCENCGNLSQDYEVCEGCKRPLPEEPKLFAPGSQTSGGQVVTVSNSTNTVNSRQFYASKLGKQAILQKQGVQQTAGKGRGIIRGRGLKSTRGNHKGCGSSVHVEPDTVTILSSEDEDDTRYPLPKHQRLEKEPALSRKRRMEDEHGRVVASTGVKRTIAPQSPNVSATKVTEQRSGGSTVIKMVDPIIHLTAQAVRIGTMQTVPENGSVEFSLKGFHMVLKFPTESGTDKVLDLRVDTREIMEILVSFTKFRVLFIRASPSCAERIRNQCGMVPNSEHYFDPSSKLDCHKYLTVLMSEWSCRDQEIFKAVCRKMETDKMCGQPNILTILPSDKANDLLVQASYVGPPKKKPITTIAASQFISQVTTTGVMTSGGLVASPVLINQGGIISQVLHVPGQTISAGHVILTLPPAQKPRPPGDEDEEEEPVDRSRSPSPVLPTFAGPVLRLFTYPPPPSTGGIPVTNEDLFCLNEGEFLNDVIIDFYLKYLVNEILTDEDKERTHVFSSFFYRRLTQKQNKCRIEDQQNMSAMEKRHSRVKTWTRHVDLFEKDFIIVPINESAHWYLAIICFPGLREPIIEEEGEIMQTGPDEQNTMPSNKEQNEDKSDKCADSNSSQLESSDPKSNQPKSDKDETTKSATSTEVDQAASNNSDKINTSKTKSRVRKTVLQPTILIFDSLSGPGRTGVVRTLREYVQVEWNVKKAAEEGSRTFTKENMRGCIPKCPQQTNFSDCGVFVLQYVESFFKTPIRDYSASPMDLSNWFPESCVKQKREELRLLILDLQQELNAELDYDPTQDGCIGISPSTMMSSIPATKDTSQMQTPVIVSIAGRVTASQQTIAMVQTTPGTLVTALPATTVSLTSNIALTSGQQTLLISPAQVKLPCVTQVPMSGMMQVTSAAVAQVSTGLSQLQQARFEQVEHQAENPHQQEQQQQEEEQQLQQLQQLQQEQQELLQLQQEEHDSESNELHCQLNQQELQMHQLLLQQAQAEQEVQPAEQLMETLQEIQQEEQMEPEEEQWQHETAEACCSEQEQLPSVNKAEDVAESNTDPSQSAESLATQNGIETNVLQEELLNNNDVEASSGSGFFSVDAEQKGCDEMVASMDELCEQKTLHSEQHLDLGQDQAVTEEYIGQEPKTQRFCDGRQTDSDDTTEAGHVTAGNDNAM